MNVKRFTARTSREALKLVKTAFGSDAVVLSTRPCAEGVEVLAMASDSVGYFERLAAPAQPEPDPPSAAPAQRPGARPPRPAPPASRPAAAPSQRLEPGERREPVFDATTVGEDVERLSMSTLSFQDYVRERMLRRRKAELEANGEPAASAPAPVATPATVVPFLRPAAAERDAARPANLAAAPVLTDEVFAPALDQGRGPVMPAVAIDPVAAAALRRDGIDLTADRVEMLNELRSMKGLIEERFSALAFMEKLQRQPRQATLSQKLLECGFSPALIRKLVASLPADGDETAWAASVLERNLVTGERNTALEDAGGIFAFIGTTGVGKTTSTAKMAASFAARHGASQLGLITLDAYRMAGQEQLRAYGRILGVPVHTAHDRTSLEDLLDLLSGKKMVLVDTGGLAQRDARTAELLEMVSQPAVQRLLVINAASQGETIEDTLSAYRVAQCRGVVLTKVDEAVKLGPALDALIRHRVKVLAVANGQRVPEDWHRLSAGTLVQRALRAAGSTAWRLDPSDVNLVFAGATPRADAATASH
jgi:flagellar biosynthesis protein FlhF